MRRPAPAAAQDGTELHMRRFTIVLATICLLAAGAGRASAETRWGVVAGLNLSTLHFNQKLVNGGRVANFSLGVKGELLIPGLGFGVDASALYTQLGGKAKLGEHYVWASDGYGTVRSYHHYLELPFNLSFRYMNLNGIENTIAPVVFLGPTFNIMLGHSHIGAFRYSGGCTSIHFGFGGELYRKVQVTASYNIGLSYALETIKLDQHSARDRWWRVAATYYF